MLEDFSKKISIETETAARSALKQHGDAVKRRFIDVEHQLFAQAEDSRAIWKVITELRSGLVVAESTVPVKADDFISQRT